MKTHHQLGTYFYTITVMDGNKVIEETYAGSGNSAMEEYSYQKKQYPEFDIYLDNPTPVEVAL